MKKAIAILLALTLCLGLAACGGTGSEDHDYILHLLETGQYDMAIHVIEGLRDGGAAAPPQEQPESTAPRPDSGTGDPYNQQYDLPPEFTGSDWLFHMTAENLLQEDISLEALVIIDFMDGNQTGFADFVYEELAAIGLENVVLAPGQSIRWDDAHPAVTHFNQRLYQFIFRDGAGTQVSINYYFHMEDMLPSDNPTSGEPPPETGISPLCWKIPEAVL